MRARPSNHCIAAVLCQAMTVQSDKLKGAPSSRANVIHSAYIIHMYTESYSYVSHKMCLGRYPGVTCGFANDPSHNLSHDHISNTNILRNSQSQIGGSRKEIYVCFVYDPIDLSDAIMVLFTPDFSMC